MAFSVTNIGVNNNAAGATVAVTVGAGGVPVGCICLVQVADLSVSALGGSVADSKSNTYSGIANVGADHNALTTNGFGRAFHSLNLATALVNTNTITYTKAITGTAASISACYITGANTSGEDTAVSVTATGSSTNPSVTSGTASVAGELFFGIASNNGSTIPLTQASGWATPPNASSGTQPSSLGGNLTNAGTTAKTYNPTTVMIANWMAAVFAYKPAAGAGPPLRTPDVLPIPPVWMPQSWAASYNLNLIGQDTMAPGQQSTDVPQSIPLTSWIRTWTLSTNLATTLGAPPSFGGASLDLPQRFPATSWPTAWSNSYNLNLIGQDQLPSGAVSVALSPTGYPLTSWIRTWTLSTNLATTLGAPPSFGGASLALPQRFPATSWPTAWSNSYNLNLIGQDQLPSGAVSVALSPAGYPLTSWIRTWTASYNLNLVGKDILPVLQMDWPLPTPPFRMPQGWTQASPFWSVKPFLQIDWPLPTPPVRLPQSIAVSYNLNLIGQDVLPVLQKDWPLPIPPVRMPQSWTQVSPFWAVKPFAQNDWPTPTPPYRLPQSWAASYNLNLIGQDVLPTGARAYDTPQRFPATSWPTSWAWSYNLNLIGQDSLPPGRQLAEPGRAYPYPPDLRTMMFSRAQFMQLPPFAQYDWPLPVPPWRSPALSAWVDPVKLNLIGQDAMAPGQQLFDLARGVPSTSWIRTWTWYSLPIVPPNPSPLNQYDWPLPFAPRPAQQLRTWEGSVNLNLVGQDAMAPGQIYDRLARGAPPPVPSWTQWYPLSLIGQDTLPIRQRDWPLPIVRPFFQQAPISFLVSSVVAQPFAQYDWPVPSSAPSFRAATTANVLPLVTIRPFAQYDWPIPIVRPQFQAAPSIFSIGLYLRPFAQYDWQIPVAPQYPANLRTAAGLTAQQLNQITIPPGRSNYELTGRPPHPISLRTYALSPTFPVSVPFRQTEWPLPNPPLYAVQLRTWVDPVKINLLGQTRFFVYDRPLPRRLPEPDHSFAYSRFPGLVPTNFAVCAHTEVTGYESSTRVSSTSSTTDIEAAISVTDIETASSITAIVAAASSTTKFASC